MEFAVDARRSPAFAAGHVPGALAIAWREGFATWVGRLVPDGASLTVVVAADQPAREIVEAARSVVPGGRSTVVAAPSGESTVPLVNAHQLEGAVMVDVRDPDEYAGSHVPGTLNLPIVELSGAVPALAGSHVVVMCGGLDRAMTAASVLRRLGHHDVAVLDGGTHAWAEQTGLELVTT